MDNKLTLPCDVSSVSDGYHTFAELYEHRCALMVALMHADRDRAWWSRLHYDGSMFQGWIIVGMKLPSGMITYHIPEKWVTKICGIECLPNAPKWDGHTSPMVVERLAEYIMHLNTDGLEA